MTKELVNVAKRNLRHYLSIATFKCEVDRTAALNCLDVIEADNTRQRNEGIEAAAKVAEDAMILLSIGTPGDGPFTRQDKAVDETREQIATAIRALKEPE